MNGPAGHSVFDPVTFMDLTITEQGSTKLIPLPPNDYIAVIGEGKTRSWTSKDGSQSGIALDVPFELELTPAAKETLGREKYTVTQGIMLDLTETGGLDMGKGKNVKLNILRDACGLNEPGKPFNFRMFQGRMVKVKTGNRVDGENIYNDVKAVAKFS